MGLAPFLVLSGLIVMPPLAWAEATMSESLQSASPWWDRPALLVEGPTVTNRYFAITVSAS